MKNHPLILACLCFLFSTFSLLSASGDGKDVIYLWPNGAPGSQSFTNKESVRIAEPTGDHVVTDVHKPSITVYLPPPGQATGAAVIVTPGGGHREIWIDHEGYNVAEWLSQHGVAAFVLKYRLALATNSTYTVDRDELGDMQRAIRLVRSRADQWGIDTNRVGVMGFSAGGELAFLAGMHYDNGKANAVDPIQRLSCRPDFQALIYPGNLYRIRVSAKSPPAFLACGANDRPDISLALPKVYLKFKREKVPVELHIFSGVGHGFGLRPTNTGEIANWPEIFDEWLGQNGFLKKQSTQTANKRQ
ncbi:MAG TPA: alpha/beta hydrolase [Verrucomicrobiae bacterium]|jgi:endo-1,4-beta-xylanase